MKCATRSRRTRIFSTWCSRRSSARATRCCRHGRCSTGLSGTVLLLYADVPLLQTSTLSRLAEHHQASLAAATVLTAELADPYGYGRIVRDEEGKVARIVEERDASADERTIREINSGIYAFALGPLFDALAGLATDNSQGEYYLTDLVAAYRRRRLRVETLSLDDADRASGCEHASRSCGAHARRARPEAPRADAVWSDARGSGDRLHRRRGRDWSGHDRRAWCGHQRTDASSAPDAASGRAPA